MQPLHFQSADRRIAARKAEAQAKGREMVIRRKVELLIHNKDGTIGQRNSYGSDSRRRQG